MRISQIFLRLPVPNFFLGRLLSLAPLLSLLLALHILSGCLNTFGITAYYKKLVFFDQINLFLLNFNSLVDRCPQLVYVYVS